MTQVLVVPRYELERLGAFTGYVDHVDRYWPALVESPQCHFVDRPLAEGDPRLLQLVPYVLVRHAEQLFAYRRGKAGSEARLHARWSVGIGGHIEATDGATPTEAYWNGYERELEEEVDLGGPVESRILGLVHDPSTEVGAVHLGIVHVVDSPHGTVTARDPALHDAGFRPIAELVGRRAEMESWSAFALDALAADDQ